MKLRSKHSPLLFLLLPSIASALAPHTIATSDETPAAAAVAAPDSADSTPPAPGIKRHGIPTKDAPVDGKDGKPHLGPFVETDGVVSTGSGSGEKEDKELPALKGRPDDPTVVDGKKIPKTNDGVMFDKNREHVQGGNTGLEGGVSEKDKARKAQEGRTGEKVSKEPTAPKEQPPLPHSEEQKIKGKTKVSSDEKENTKTSKTSKTDKDDDTSFTGLDVSLDWVLPPSRKFTDYFCRSQKTSPTDPRTLPNPPPTPTIRTTSRSTRAKTHQNRLPRLLLPLWIKMKMASFNPSTLSSSLSP